MRNKGYILTIGHTLLNTFALNLSGVLILLGLSLRVKISIAIRKTPMDVSIIVSQSEIVFSQERSTVESDQHKHCHLRYTLKAFK